VLVQHLRQLAAEGLAIRREPVEVGGGQVDQEVVGREPLLAAEDLRGVVDLTLQGGGDLHRLDGTAKSPRESARHQSFEPLLEAV
jgi:hypothetical protein